MSVIQPTPRERHALLIGVNYVNDSNARLYGCINDAVQTKYFLIDAFGYPQDNITVLRDDSFEGAIPPTMSNILSHLTQLVNISESCEEIWIHYSGHGTHIQDTNGDEADGRDEVIVPCDYTTSGIIRDDVLFAILSKSKCRTYIVMDCCHSGSIVDLPYLFDVNEDEIVMKRANSKVDASMFENKQIYMISGSRDVQTAADDWNYESRISMGATTQALIDTIREHNHHIALDDLLRELHSWMTQHNYEQRPNISCVVEDGLKHILRKPEYELIMSSEECTKCKEYELEIDTLKQEKQVVEKKLEKSTKENTTAWFTNNSLKQRVEQLQNTLNHFTIPEKRKQIEQIINKQHIETKEQTVSQRNAQQLLQRAIDKKRQLNNSTNKQSVSQRNAQQLLQIAIAKKRQFNNSTPKQPEPKKEIVKPKQPEPKKEIVKPKQSEPKKEIVKPKQPEPKKEIVKPKQPEPKKEIVQPEPKKEVVQPEPKKEVATRRRIPRVYQGRRMFMLQ